ncbi:hypothetical protein PAXRUDRAFT_831074 [Paxillus rubicundulus Ve08.2h10]|uniref:FHA domain-containing protein n=1 Tax=Paxillus rubicundulus Ve08.2h10 TaxID=930991 RepID=A0A0D0DSK0_9AGAM|nr:hypothetical protein PAXRUDRAFT_831074 [Paxillus rubicundulus Ve08.2h10]
MDPSEVGRFGTLRLMKRLEPNTPVASFPIDDDTVTFGRDPTCSVRLYYPSVSALHAKILFQERKAFVVVLGSSGLYIDGCHVLPSTNLAMPAKIPVSNNSEIEIHKKRFVFTYPPKELRPALYTSPSKDVSMTPGTRRKALRMSMIQSAEVFTPRPSKNPRENLRILQSPLKKRSKSPLKQQYASEEGDINEAGNEEEIILVDGNYPHVVEEEKDLVILESVEVEVPQPPQTPARAGAFARIVPSSGTNQYQTPHRRPQARPSLHRAVLIRSAQRAILKQETEREEEGEEKEVEDFIAEEAEGYDDDDDDDEHGEEEGGEEAEGEHESTQPADQGSRWRKSMEVVKGFGWPFRGSSTTPEEVEDQENEDQSEGETDEDEMDVDHELPPSSDPVPDSPTDLTPPVEPTAGTPARPHQWGNFMTPQVPPPMNSGVGRGAGRNSFGGVLSAGAGVVGPRRVRVEPKWRVTDIVVPLSTRGADDHVAEPEIKEEEAHPPPDTGRRTRLSDEERKAIRERRRSALTTPDPYFGGQVPGMSGRRYSNVLDASPAPLPSFLSSAIRSQSPTKLQNTSPTKLTTHAEEESGSEEEEDTRSLLDRMKKTVEEMKRRRSVGPICEAEDEEYGAKHDLDVGGTSDDVQGEGLESLNEEGSDKENGGAESGIEIDEAVQQPEGNTVDENAGVVVVDEEKDEDAPVDFPLPALTRLSIPQTPTLESLKHLFPQPKSSAASNTPAVKSMRDLFKNTRSDVPHTPRMQGMRDMFLREERGKQISETPVFEGVGEMMQTPPGYREEEGATDEDGGEGIGNETLHPPPQTESHEAPAASTTTTNRRRTPRPNAGASKPTATHKPVAIPALPKGDPAATGTTEAVPPESHDNAPPPRKARLLRGRKETPVDEEDEPEIQGGAPVLVNTEPKTFRSRRVKTEPDLEVTALRRPPTRSRATPIPEVILETRITRSEPVKAKSRLPGKTVPATTCRATSTEHPGQSSRFSRKVGTGTRAGTSRIAPTPLPPIHNVDGDDSDPLDSIGQSEDAPVVRRRTRTATAPRVKQEDAEILPTATRKRAATTTSRAKPAPVRKKPMTAAVTKVVLESSSESGDKENTPSREDEEPPQEPPKATRVKRAAVKSKEAEKEAEPPKPRTTRGTRGRN